MRNVVAVELDVAFVGLDQPGDHVEHGGLAGSVRPEQSDRLAPAQRQAHTPHDLALGEAFLDAVDRQRSFFADDRREWVRGARRGAEHAVERMRGRLRLALEQPGRQMSVAVEPVWHVAPRLGRCNRTPVKIAFRRAADRRRRDAPGAAERHALARREADALRAATVHHRLVDRTEIDAPKLGRRQFCRMRRAAKRLQDTEHARLN